MTRDHVIRALRSHSAELRGMGVERLYLFGSTARDDARAESDVDLFFDFGNPRFSLIDLAQVKDRLSAIVQGRADVMTRGSLHPRLRAGIEQSAVQVF